MSTHATVQKLVEQDFHFLFTEEGKKSRVNFLITHHCEHTDVLQEQNNTPANIKGPLTPKINGMRVNGRLSSEQQPVAFNFPSDRNIVCSVRLCLHCVKPVGRALGWMIPLASNLYLCYIFKNIITKNSKPIVQWKVLYMLDSSQNIRVYKMETKKANSC